MILSVRADHPSFQSITFEPGFNVILADRTQDSTKKDTRNGLGKSTLLEIIHFCLGSKVGQKHPLVSPELGSWTFTVELQLGDCTVAVSRTTTEPQRVRVDGETRRWPIKPTRNATTGTWELATRDWTSVLGTLMFGISVEDGGKHHPSFRGLISYFIRRGKDAYSTPFENHRKQREADKQVHNAFLLGLEWRDAVAFQRLKERREALNGYLRAAKEILNEMLGTIGELEALRVRLAAKKDVEADQLRTFKVHPQYESIAERANQLTQEIHELANQNLVDARTRDLYAHSVEEEKEPADALVESVYEEARVALSEAVKRRLQDVRHFHHELVANRKRFLREEIDRLAHALEERRAAIHQKTDTRAGLLMVLSTHGALEEYSQLQRLHQETVSELEAIDLRIRDLKTFQEGKSALAIEQEVLLQRARHDLEERSEQRNQAITLFNANTERLYKAPGNLVIDVQPAGFQFAVEIERSDSQGIGNMKVFCYDLMLAQLWSAKPQSPGVLIHDSMIFDGVDERQVALALELAEAESRTRGFQYICTLNTDTVPWKEFTPKFDLRSFARATLTDKTDEGRLLGVRF